MTQAEENRAAGLTFLSILWYIHASFCGMSIYLPQEGHRRPLEQDDGTMWPCLAAPVINVSTLLC